MFTCIYFKPSVLSELKKNESKNENKNENKNEKMKMRMRV